MQRVREILKKYDIASKLATFARSFIDDTDIKLGPGQIAPMCWPGGGPEAIFEWNEAGGHCNAMNGKFPVAGLPWTYQNENPGSFRCSDIRYEQYLYEFNDDWGRRWHMPPEGVTVMFQRVCENAGCDYQFSDWGDNLCTGRPIWPCLQGEAPPCTIEDRAALKADTTNVTQSCQSCLSMWTKLQPAPDFDFTGMTSDTCPLSFYTCPSCQNGSPASAANPWCDIDADCYCNDDHCINNHHQEQFGGCSMPLAELLVAQLQASSAPPTLVEVRAMCQAEVELCFATVGCQGQLEAVLAAGNQTNFADLIADWSSRGWTNPTPDAELAAVVACLDLSGRMETECATAETYTTTEVYNDTHRSNIYGLGGYRECAAQCRETLHGLPTAYGYNKDSRSFTCHTKGFCNWQVADYAREMLGGPFELFSVDAHLQFVAPTATHSPNFTIGDGTEVYSCGDNTEWVESTDSNGNAIVVKCMSVGGYGLGGQVFTLREQADLANLPPDEPGGLPCCCECQDGCGGAYLKTGDCYNLAHTHVVDNITRGVCDCNGQCDSMPNYLGDMQQLCRRNCPTTCAYEAHVTSIVEVDEHAIQSWDGTVADRDGGGSVFDDHFKHTPTILPAAGDMANTWFDVHCDGTGYIRLADGILIAMRAPNLHSEFEVWSELAREVIIDDATATPDTCITDEQISDFFFVWSPSFWLTQLSTWGPDETVPHLLPTIPSPAGIMAGNLGKNYDMCPPTPESVDPDCGEYCEAKCEFQGGAWRNGCEINCKVNECAGQVHRDPRAPCARWQSFLDGGYPPQLELPPTCSAHGYHRNGCALRYDLSWLVNGETLAVEAGTKTCEHNPLSLSAIYLGCSSTPLSPPTFLISPTLVRVDIDETMDELAQVDQALRDIHNTCSDKPTMYDVLPCGCPYDIRCENVCGDASSIDVCCQCGGGIRANYTNHNDLETAWDTIRSMATSRGGRLPTADEVVASAPVYPGRDYWVPIVRSNSAPHYWINVGDRHGNIEWLDPASQPFGSRFFYVAMPSDESAQLLLDELMANVPPPPPGKCDYGTDWCSASQPCSEPTQTCVPLEHFVENSLARLLNGGIFGITGPPELIEWASDAPFLDKEYVQANPYLYESDMISWLMGEVKEPGTVDIVITGEFVGRGACPDVVDDFHDRETTGWSSAGTSMFEVQSAFIGGDPDIAMQYNDMMQFDPVMAEQVYGEDIGYEKLYLGEFGGDYLTTEEPALTKKVFNLDRKHNQVTISLELTFAGEWILRDTVYVFVDGFQVAATKHRQEWNEREFVLVGPLTVDHTTDELELKITSNIDQEQVQRCCPNIRPSYGIDSVHVKPECPSGIHTVSEVPDDWPAQLRAASLGAATNASSGSSTQGGLGAVWEATLTDAVSLNQTVQPEFERTIVGNVSNVDLRVNRCNASGCDYFVVDAPTIDEMDAACMQSGGRLASIISAEELAGAQAACAFATGSTRTTQLGFTAQGSANSGGKCFIGILGSKRNLRAGNPVFEWLDHTPYVHSILSYVWQAGRTFDRTRRCAVISATGMMIDQPCPGTVARSTQINDGMDGLNRGPGICKVPTRDISIVDFNLVESAMATAFGFELEGSVVQQLNPSRADLCSTATQAQKYAVLYRVASTDENFDDDSWMPQIVVNGVPATNVRAMSVKSNELVFLQDKAERRRWDQDGLTTASAQKLMLIVFEGVPLEMSFGLSACTRKYNSLIPEADLRTEFVNFWRETFLEAPHQGAAPQGVGYCAYYDSETVVDWSRVTPDLFTTRPFTATTNDWFVIGDDKITLLGVDESLIRLGTGETTRPRTDLITPYRGGGSFEVVVNNSWCTVGEMLDAVNCEGGVFDDDDSPSTPCVPCPLNTYATSNGTNPQYPCLPCPTSASSEMGSTSVQECKPTISAYWIPCEPCTQNGGTGCGMCPRGYILSETGAGYDDLDECAIGDGDCDSLMGWFPDGGTEWLTDPCANSQGSYSCNNCPGGFEKQGQQCAIPEAVSEGQATVYPQTTLQMTAAAAVIVDGSLEQEEFKRTTIADLSAALGASADDLELKNIRRAGDRRRAQGGDTIGVEFDLVIKAADSRIIMDNLTAQLLNPASALMTGSVLGYAPDQDAVFSFVCPAGMQRKKEDRLCLSCTPDKIPNEAGDGCEACPVNQEAAWSDGSLKPNTTQASGDVCACAPGHYNSTAIRPTCYRTEFQTPDWNNRDPTVECLPCIGTELAVLACIDACQGTSLTVKAGWSRLEDEFTQNSQALPVEIGIFQCQTKPDLSDLEDDEDIVATGACPGGDINIDAHTASSCNQGYGPPLCGACAPNTCEDPAFTTKADCEKADCGESAATRACIWDPGYTLGSEGECKPCDANASGTVLLLAIVGVAIIFLLAKTVKIWQKYFVTLKDMLGMVQDLALGPVIKQMVATMQILSSMSVSLDVQLPPEFAAFIKNLAFFFRFDIIGWFKLGCLSDGSYPSTLMTAIGFVGMVVGAVALVYVLQMRHVKEALADAAADGAELTFEEKEEAREHLQEMYLMFDKDGCDLFCVFLCYILLQFAALMMRMLTQWRNRH